MQQLEADTALEEPSKFRERVAALERLDVHHLEGLLARTGGQGAESAIYERAQAMNARLEAANLKFCETIRDSIRRGDGARVMRAHAGALGGADGSSDAELGESYDYVDELLGGVLRFATPNGTIRPLAAEMVAYQPTPARHIFDLLRRLRLAQRDVFVDLGAGLGHVALLAAICTNAQSIGIETEEVYVRCAREAALDLNLRNVSFLEQDARKADLSCGTVFYLYTPFRGTILREVLNLLRREAARRAIRVCTFGPCTTEIAQESWLEPVGRVEAGRAAVFKRREQPADLVSLG